jgi:hypothetical protein
VDVEDLVKTVWKYAALSVVGFVLGIVFAVLGVNEYVTLAVIVGISGVLVYWVDDPQKRPSADDPEAARQRRRAIAACAQETLDKLDPPLAEEHYRAAFRRLCRAIADGRRRVRLFAGDRTVEVTLEGS